MHMNVFSVQVRLEAFDDAEKKYGDTMAAFAEGLPGFKGMLGLVNRVSGNVMSIALHENEDTIANAKRSDLNEHEVERYRHLFVTEPVSKAYRIEARYMPMNRPFPGDSASYARVTSGWVRPKHVAKTVARNRDSLIFAAISEPGCCGYFLCANYAAGEIFGISLWDTWENLQRSESPRGYYHREMARNNDVLLGPYEYDSYEVFNRLMSK